MTEIIPDPRGEIVYTVECVVVKYEEWVGVLTGCVTPYFSVCRECEDDDETPPDPCFPRLKDCARVFIPKVKGIPISFKTYCRYLEYAKVQADGMACYCDCVSDPNCYTPSELNEIRGFVGDVCTCNESHPRPCNCHSQE